MVSGDLWFCVWFSRLLIWNVLFILPHLLSVRAIATLVAVDGTGTKVRAQRVVYLKSTKTCIITFLHLLIYHSPWTAMAEI